jgi:hypothetical protein
MKDEVLQFLDEALHPEVKIRNLVVDGLEGNSIDTRLGKLSIVSREPYDDDPENNSKYVIISLRERMFSIEVYYDSWCNADYHVRDIVEVKPVKVEKIEYRKVKRA